MIVSSEDGRLLVITQNDHAHFAGELLSLWRGDSLPEHPRRRELIFAARQHDNGWRELDAAPPTDPETGRPHDFISLPQPARREVWQRGIRRFAESDPYAALLILEHAFHLHRTHADDPEWAETFREWREMKEALHQETGVAEPELLHDYRFIDLSDTLSLAVCRRWQEPLEHHAWHATVAAGASGLVLSLTPFPLAGATTFRIPCRRIPDRRYHGEADLGGTLAAARWQEMMVRVVPET